MDLMVSMSRSVEWQMSKTKQKVYERFLQGMQGSSGEMIKEVVGRRCFGQWIS